MWPSRTVRSPLRPLLAGLLAVAAWRGAGADDVLSWGSLRAAAQRRDGLFGAWDVRQRDVLEALLAIERRRRDGGIDQLERLVRDDPTDLAARDALALACRRQGRIEEAIAQFRVVLTLDPTSVDSRLNLAELFESIGRLDLAEAELVAFALFHPGRAPAARRLAAFYTSAGRHASAAAVLRGVVRIAPADRGAWLDFSRALILSGRADEAKAAIEAARRLPPNDAAPALLLADAHRTEGDWKAAQADLEAAAAAYPDSEAPVQLGLLYLHQRNWQAAREVLGKAVEPARPVASSGCPSPFALVGSSIAALACRDREAAIQASNRLREAGGEQVAPALLANVWLAAGDASGIEAVYAGLPASAEGPREAYKRLLDLLKDRRDDRERLAVLLGLIGLFRQAKWAVSAVAAAEEAQKLAPESTAIAALLATCYAEAGRPDNELAVREGLVRTHPDDRQLALAFAEALLARGKMERAQEACTEFLKRFYDDLETRLLLARIAFRRGDYAAAATHSQVAMNKHPLEGRAWRLHIDALLAQGKLAEAATALQRRQGADPAYVPGAFDRAVLAGAEGRLDDALADCTRLLRRADAEPRAWFLAGLLHERKRDLAGAVGAYQAASRLEPDHLAAHEALARTAGRLGLGPAAVEAWRAVARLAPDRLDLQLAVADALVREGRQAEAIAHLRVLKPAKADDRRAIDARLAGCFLAQGDPARALALAEPILSEAPDDALARRVAFLARREQDDLAGAVQACRRALARAPSDEARTDLAKLQIIQQQYEPADQVLADLLTRADTPARRFALLQLRAVAGLALGLPARARTSVELAVAALPKGATPSADLIVLIAALGGETPARQGLAHIRASSPTQADWLGAALTRFIRDRELTVLVLTASAASAAGWHRRAAQLYEAAAARAPGEPALLYSLACAQAEAGLLNPALASAQELVRLCPTAGEPLVLLGAILAKLGKTDLSIDAQRRALTLLPKQDKATRLAFAQRFIAAGRVDEAIEAFRSFLELEPDHAAACNNLAWLYASHKPDKLADALPRASLAAKAHPEKASYRDTLGWVLFLRKDYDAARMELEAALALEPTKATYLYHLGMVDFAQGRQERARRALRMALALDPNLPEAGTARATLAVLEPKPLTPPATP